MCIGCKGGVGHEAFDYFKKNAIKEASKYPYEGKEQKCKIEPTLEKLERELNLKHKKALLPSIKVKTYFMV